MCTGAGDNTVPLQRLLVRHMLGDAEAKETHQDERKDAQEYQEEPSLEGAETRGVGAGHS